MFMFYRSSREDRHLFRPFLFFFRLCSMGGPANLCDSVATECLPAAECSALQQPSPHPTARSMPPCGSLQTGFPPLPPPRPLGQEQLFQNWPTCIEFTTTAEPESVFSNLRLLSRSVSVLQGSLYPEMEAFKLCFGFIFLVSLMDLPLCIFILLLS